MYQYQVANVYIATIGTGAVSSNFPFATYYMDARTQYFYLASEINTGISGILQIGFDVIAADPGAMNNFSIKFQNTSLTSLSGFITTGWTTCSSPAWIQFPEADGRTLILHSRSSIRAEICWRIFALIMISILNTQLLILLRLRVCTGDVMLISLVHPDVRLQALANSSTSPPGRANTRFTLKPA